MYVTCKAPGKGHINGSFRGLKYKCMLTKMREI